VGRAEFLLEQGQARQCTFQRKEVPRIGAPESDASNQPLDIIHSIEELAQVFSKKGISVQFFDGI
jgi:hypothetical protein